ncbi:MAG TPA: Ig-like domain-containing protein, partial [Gemmatimonadales bacterium]|nr:Ig-like domain-containing protein [Gemmatimonadales bacterium]
MKKLRSVMLRAAFAAIMLVVFGQCTGDHQPTSPPAAPDRELGSIAPTGPVGTEILVGAGNTGRCENVTKDEATALLLDNIQGTVFALGDNVRQNGTLQEYNDCYGPSWGRHKARTRPAAGEIEYKTSGAPGYFAYFGASAGDPTKGYYSYNLGAWHVIVLNTSIAMTAGSAQEQWLRADLTANTKQCTVAYMHYGRFSSVGTGVRKEVKPLWTALYDFRADIIMAAHYRLYERFAPQTPDEVADPQGLRQFTVGTGGQGVDKFAGGSRVNSVVRADNLYGVLKLTLADGTYGWDFVGLPGQTFTDSGTGTCHTRVLVASVAVTPASASVLVGATQQLTATPLDADGNPLSGRVVTWASSNPAIASVDAAGLVTAVASGEPVTITATSEGKSGTAAISVSTVAVATVEVSPATGSIEAGGDTIRLTAVAKDADGNVLSGRAVTWTSGDPAATVSTSGLVTGVTPGAPTITATIEGQTGSADITVVPAAVGSVVVTPATLNLETGAGFVLTATLKDARGNTLTGRPVLWTSSDEAVAIVESDDGDVNGVAVGTATITATSEGQSGTATVNVVPPPVASVDVTPTTASILAGSTVQLTATPKSANGTPLPGRVVTWASGNPAAATVDANGLVTGVGAGVATITATSEGQSGTANVGVGLVPVASVDVSPATASVAVGGNVQLTATPKDANGNPLAGRTVAWTRSDPAVGWVDTNGLALGLSAGNVTITATIEGQTGTSALTVTPLPPGSPVVLVGAGDIASCPLPGDELTADVLDRTPGTVFLAGDDAYEDGTIDEFNTCYNPSWGRHKSRTRPTPGNHEYQTPEGAGYYEYFGAAAGDPTKGYYSYNLGDWHVIVLNPEINSVAGSPQEQWLRADLAANSETQCTIAIFHEPVFSSSSRDGTGGYTVGRAFYQALYEAYADVIVNGHDHVYERFAPQSPSGVLDNVQGIREFVVGTGGASLHGTSGTALPNSEARNGQAWGVLKLTLRAGSYDWEFLPGAGQIYSDAGSGVCHAPVPVPNQPPTAVPGGPYVSEGAIAFNGSASSDPENNVPLTYSWDFGDGTTGTGATPTHTYGVDGTYTVTLTVTDSKGLSGTPATTTATAANIAPTVNAGPDVSTLTGGTLTLNANFTDPGVDAPWSYTFDWGDGATSTGSASAPGSISANHIYAVAGPYTARVTVVDNDGGSGWDEVLVTVAPSSTPQVFIGAGNIASCSNDRDQLTANIIDANPGSTVFALGDNAYPNGTLADYSNCYGPTWGRHKSRTHPAPGNREYASGSAVGYFDYWGAAAGVALKGWYSYDLGDWHIIVLNDQTAFGAGSEQEAWLRADLAASTKVCTLAYWHNPRFFSSTSPGWTSDGARKILWDDLYAAHAEIVLNGQQHQYERMAPMRPDGTRDDVNGILEI